MSTPTNPYRLTRDVIPSAYRLFLTPDLEAFTFAGRVEIDVDVIEPVTSFTLNAIELDLGPATLTNGATTVRSSETIFNETYETATFTFDAPLPVGTAVVEIAFTGILNDQLHGFYRSQYTDADGVNHVIATTQFENSDARRAFPCWDEPAFKATYQVTLTVPSHLRAYSNSPVASETDLGNGQTTITYKPTMKMSTYLVAFVVGPFDETEALDVDGVPLRVVYPKGKGHLTELALDSGAHALRFFANYFKIPYPGEKLDMIAIPDFAFGAMENLGCVTYRENALLVNPETASLAEKTRIVEVVSHELAHMWFGDLVTMDWWQGIWLNEAFATFMAALCQDHYRPEWRTWAAFQPEREGAQQVDGLHSTRPVEYEVVSPDDMRGMFDVLTYEKGGWILRMIEQYLGEETFREGIHRYLVKHSYANTVTADLWNALEEASGEPVGAIMDTFILQGGYPLVTFDDGRLRQEPFQYVATSGPSNIGQTWRVPMHLRSLTSGERVRLVLDADAQPVTLPAPVVVNAGGWSYFRTRYGASELAALAPRVSELDDVERATLVADTWALLFSSQITWEDFLAVAGGLGEQEEPSPWVIVAEAFDKAERALDEVQLATLRAQARAIVAPHFTRLGWDKREGENELTGQMRAIIIGLMGTVIDDETVIAEAIRRFEANELEGDLARTILRIVARQDRPGDYEEFLRRYDAAADAQEEVRYMFSMAAFRDERVALDLAKRAFDTFRKQDAPLILGVAVGNAITGPAVWRYLTSRWDDVVGTFPTNTQYRVSAGITSFITDPAFSDEVAAFHAAHPLPGQRSIEQFIEIMRAGQAFANSLRTQF